MNVPSDRKYSKEHEWALVDADGTVLIGISDFAQDQLGDVVFVELPKAGARVTQFQRMGEVESVKAVSDLYAPLSGEVVAANADLVSKPELLNEDPYKRGWLIRIRPAAKQEMDNLLDAAQYALQTHA